MNEETQRLEQVSDWLIRLEEGTLADEEIVRWVEWCEADPENRRAFERLWPLWQGLDAASALHPDRVAQLLATKSHSVPRWRALLKPRRATHQPAVEQPRSGVSRLHVGLAASVLIAIGAAGWWQVNQPQRLQSIDKLHTAIARDREATLPDGSSLALGAGSSVAIDFKATHRNIDLGEGEAFFTVKHDQSRPFIVRAGNLQVRAVGTAFDVLRTGSRVAVTVQEGVVDVTADNQRDNTIPQVVRAPAGYQVIYDATHLVSPILRIVDPATATSWRQGRLEYIEEPLASVIANVNRYSSRRITLQGVDTGLAYTGTIEVRSIDEWLRALPRIFPVRVVGTDQETIIQAQASSDSASSRPATP
ncbi:FecR family protein [Steroidobacter sp.]|uniref:FecR family protein n=1 Tax=Steroidobacter sp. TaxID=1978227 RepID=UPI001A5DF80C|nr:FecR domain-containing protein [Steroidobacter sp.]MBL8269806.1 FecR domain-containing protein [Steroidobacter sp.]